MTVLLYPNYWVTLLKRLNIIQPNIVATLRSAAFGCSTPLPLAAPLRVII